MSAPAPGGSRRSAWVVALGAAAWLLGAGMLLRAPGGLTGLYSFAGADGREVEVTRRVDPCLDFAIPQRLDAAYLFNWDIARFGFPAEMPPYVIHWRGLVVVPESGVYGFSVDAQGEATLSIDGAPVEIRPDASTERRLSPGLHPIALDYRLASGEARLVLSWQPPGRRLQPIPTAFLAADASTYASRRARHRSGEAALLALAAALAFFMLWARRRPASGAARLLDALRGERPRLALGAILMLAALLRFHDYALVPFHHETADEYQHAWEGWHLLHERVPAAWSTFPDQYPPDRTVDFRWFGDRYILVRPYFDHPPLFSLPVGLFCSLAGAPAFLACTLPVMRLVPILMSLVGLLLLVRLARVYGLSERAGLLAALVYATVPVIILGHRLVKAENLLSILFMGALLAIEAVPGAAAGAVTRRGALWAGVLCGLALWTKATGLAVLATVLLLLAAKRKWRDAALVAAVAAGFLALYAAYGWAYDAEIFLKVLRAQSTSKWVTLDSVSDLLGGKAVVKWFGRGSYLWLLLAAGMAAWRRERFLLLPLVLYGTLIAMTADHRVIYGWYRIPFYPFLCVAAGIYLEEMLERGDLFLTFPFAASAVASGLLYALPAAVSGSRWTMIAFAVVAVAPFLPRLVWDRPWAERLGRAGAWLLLLAFLWTSVATVERLVEIYAATRGVA